MKFAVLALVMTAQPFQIPAQMNNYNVGVSPELPEANVTSERAILRWVLFVDVLTALVKVPETRETECETVPPFDMNSSSGRPKTNTAPTSNQVFKAIVNVIKVSV